MGKALPISKLTAGQIIGNTLGFMANEYSGDEHEELFHRVAVLLKEHDRLQAIVEKLPKTIDGVPVVPGDVVYWRRKSDHYWSNEGPIHYIHEAEIQESSVVTIFGNVATPPASSCYSTREAAEAAAKENE